MDREEYSKVLQKAKRAQRADIERGLSGELPVLDEMVPELAALPALPMGLIQIPIDQIAGTRTKGRTTAFAPNFLPLLAPNTEFATKWMLLYDHVVEDGLRDAITALEYMHKFYVIEGNKRVSVMKHLGAADIPAVVTRIIPERTDEKENKIYFEFLPFYEATGIYNIWFSEEGSFAKLVELVGKKPGEKWTQDEVYDFKSLYSRFSEVYNAVGGEKLSMTAADALLIYIDIYGYKNSCSKMTDEINKDIRRIWEEFQVKSNDEQQITLLMDAPGDAPRNVFSAMLRPLPQKLKVGFVYHSNHLISGWTYSHELGRKHVEKVFGKKVETVIRENVKPEDVEQVIEELIAEGCKVIFTTTQVFLNGSVRPSVQHHDVKILNCSLIAEYYHVRSYYLRIYEAKFIIGAIAGALAENDQIGYVADFPIYGIPASINAFALGARMTNPRAKVHLEWSVTRGKDVYEAFRQEEVKIISNKDISAPHHDARDFGLYRMEEDGSTTNLAVPAWHWGKLYELILKSIFNGTWKDEDDLSNGRQALNYWLGMSSGAIEVLYSRKLPDGVQRLVNLLSEGIQTGSFRPFAGKIVDQSGAVRNEGGKPLSPAEILAMDYLVDNVVGDFPAVETLTEIGQQLVKLQGIKHMTAPDAAAIGWEGLPGKESDE